MPIALGQFTRKRRIGKPSRWLYPAGVENAYGVKLVRYVREVFSEITRVVLPQLPYLYSKSGLGGEGVRRDGWMDDLEGMFTGLRHIFPVMTKKLSLSVAGVALDTNQWNQREGEKVVKSALGINLFTTEPWLRGTLDSFAQQNLLLVKGLTEDALNKVQAKVVEGFMQGRSSEAIAKSITHGDKALGEKDGIQGITEKRARGIARDQVGKLNGRLTQYRQTEIGVKSYLWRTMLDGRVRPEHRMREGKVFLWASPPEGGAPGEDYNCRCYAEPNFKDILDDLPAGFFED